MREVIFIVDFSNRKKGDVFLCDGQLASQLVRVDQVAEYYYPKKQEAKKDKPVK